MSRRENSDKKDASSPAWRTWRGLLRLECRECEVICERVVSPWQCLKSKCRYVYSYHDKDTTYFGCLYKVFSPELDLSAFSEDRKRGGRDPYGKVRVSRPPRPECRVTIEQAYQTSAVSDICCNPTFFHEPVGLTGERIRLITGPSYVSDEDRGPRS